MLATLQARRSGAVPRQKPGMRFGEPDRQEGVMTMMEQRRPAMWTPGDWNAFFGFGTNILVNMLVLTGLLRFVLKMPDAIVFGRILPAIGLMMCLSTFYYAFLAYRLALEDRPQRRVRAALGRQRAAHVHRHLRDHAADHAQDQRSDQGLGGGPGLGVLPELHPDDRRLHRALSSARSRRAPRCSARWPASRSPSSRCGRRSKST